MEENIYHYCPPETFDKIIKNNKIWYSDCTKMNDPSEYSLGYKSIKEIITEEYSYALPLLTEIAPENLGNTFDVLICSFSYNEDCLSLWRSYSKDGQGISIGVSQERLFVGNIVDRYCHKKDSVSGGTEIVPIIYDEVSFKEKIKEQLQHWKFPENEKEQRKKTRLAALRYEFIRLCSIFKSNYYKDEREVRSLIAIDHYTDGYKTKSRNGSYGETKYHELDLGFSGISYIAKIVRGPKCNISTNSIKKCLSEAGLKNIKIKDSKINYR